MKWFLKKFVQPPCRWILKRWFPWQYDVGIKLEDAEKVVRLWELDKDKRLALSHELKISWNRQVTREKFLGKRLVGWLRKTGDLYFYPKV